MDFNLYGPATTNDIKVGYIDPTLGYVDGVSIDEANVYASNNPGTPFIFIDGNNNIRYLNINEVNALTVDDIVSTGSTCGGIQDYKSCGPPKIQFFGGSGIGAAGNPVVGKDGSLLAVDLVSGGFGYQYPPIVAAKDDCQFGSGATLTAVLGTTTSQIEVYDGEEDFEEYILPEVEEEFGVIYGPNGEELGPWEPDVYSTINQDPLKDEIEAYQRALESPFWTTRKSQPNRISALGIDYASQDSYEVTFPSWGEFMNQYAISPIKPSDTRGTDEAGKVFTLEWEYDFPITGEYIFRGVCDDIGQVYIDDVLVGDLQNFSQNPSPLQKTVMEGVHIIRVDLLNQQFTETTSGPGNTNLKAKFIQQGSNFYLKVDGTGTGKIKFVMDVNDASYIAGLAAKEVRIPSDSGKVKFKRTEYGLGDVLNLTAPTEETIKESGTFTAGRLYGPIEIIGADPAAKGPIPIKGESNKLALRDADGDDENIKITIEKAEGEGSGSIVVNETISPRSWNENPIGVSMIIEAPVPPVPREELPEVEGECPPNPIWTTRFPNSSQLWYPVRNELWEDFFNRYAISPVQPLNTPGSDGSGVLHKNSWQIDIPYSGYYNFQVQRDNTARIYVDGNLAFDARTSGDELWVKSGLVNKIKSQKVFLEKGTRTISIELENTSQNINSTIDAKVFSTQDWRVGSPPSGGELKPKFIQQGSNFYLKVDGTGTGEISFVMDVNDASYIAGLAAKEVRIPSDSGKVKFVRTEYGLGDVLNLSAPTEETIKEKGTFTGGQLYGPIEIIGADPAALGPVPISKDGSNKFALRDADGDDENIKITIEKVKNVQSTSSGSQSPTLDGVTYEGPSLSAYRYKDWGTFMNDYSVYVGSDLGVKTLVWKNVNFFESGIYKFNFQADNIATLKIGGREIFKTSDFAGEPVQYTANFTQGRYDVVVELENVANSRDNRSDNPSGVALYISKDVVFSDSNKASWVENPMGISAVLIPPPCSKQIGGKGVVSDVLVEDPGNGYLSPEVQGPSYNVTLVLDKVFVENPGINYRCGEDQIQIVPSNGAVLDYKCDSFGRISEVLVLNPGFGFDIYPSINIPSETGVNATFRPVFRVVRDPVQLLEDQLIKQEALIQVTDLVGLKQTGYVDGRAYYGAVYYDQGIPYAGYYKTAGTQVRVYATLQESITAQVTTPASAIQRSGTDITNNDPRLNIPRTPQSTTEQQ